MDGLLSWLLTDDDSSLSWGLRFTTLISYHLKNTPQKIKQILVIHLMYQNKIKKTGKWHVALKILDVAATSRKTMNKNQMTLQLKWKKWNDKKACYLATLMMKASISTLELFLTSTCRTADSPDV